MKKKIIVVCAVAAFAAAILTGCGKRTGDTTDTSKTGDTSSSVVTTEETTEAAIQVITTEAVTETAASAQTETQTAQTEAVSETAATVTEPVFTEAATETESETDTSSYPDLSESEELQSESDYDTAKTYYAKDDMNIRNTPSTESDDNIISSYEQGQEVTVTGETPSWYIISKDDGDGAYSGYVYKSTLSETVVEPKSDAERAQINAQYETSADTSEGYEVTLAADANIRAGADGNAEIVGVVPSGETVTVTAEEGEWLYISYDGNSGYINRNLIEQ